MLTATHVPRNRDTGREYAVRRPWLWASAIAASSVASSIGLRLFWRGDALPGMGLVLASHGKRLWADLGWRAVPLTLYQVRHFWLPSNAWTLPYGLVPGWLAYRWPWLYWQVVLMFVTWVTTLIVLMAASGWSLRDLRGLTIALLCWGASPILLSMSVEVFPWASGMLPCALAVLIAVKWSERPAAGATTRSKWMGRLLVIGGAALTCELAWHTYEIAKSSVGLVWLLAAIMMPRLDWVVRLGWGTVGGLELVDMSIWHHTPNTHAFLWGNAGAGVGILPALRHAWAMLAVPVPMYAFLIVAGAAALFYARPFFGALWLVHLGTVLALAAAGPNLLRARRFILVEGTSILLVLDAFHRAPRWVRHATFAWLAFANVVSINDAVVFFRNPAPRFSLPAVESWEGNGLIDRVIVAQARATIQRVRNHVPVTLAYPKQGDEITNPGALLDRVYLAVSDADFRRYVTVTGRPDCDYGCRIPGCNADPTCRQSERE